MSFGFYTKESDNGNRKQKGGDHIQREKDGEEDKRRDKENPAEYTNECKDLRKRKTLICTTVRIIPAEATIAFAIPAGPTVLVMPAEATIASVMPTETTVLVTPAEATIDVVITAEGTVLMIPAEATIAFVTPTDPVETPS